MVFLRVIQYKINTFWCFPETRLRDALRVCRAGMGGSLETFHSIDEMSTIAVVLHIVSIYNRRKNTQGVPSAGLFFKEG